MAIYVTNFAHGTTVDNENGISSGWNDTELSDLGKDQGLKLRELVQDRKFDVVFCSDTKRAYDTAKLAFGGNAKIVVDSRLRECNYGDLNGGLSSVVEPMQESNFDKQFPNGESYDDVKARIADFFEFLKQGYQSSKIAIVSHKAPQLAMEVLLNGKTWDQALAEDWRKTKAWQPGWDYVIK